MVLKLAGLQSRSTMSVSILLKPCRRANTNKKNTKEISPGHVDLWTRGPVDTRLRDQPCQTLEKCDRYSLSSEGTVVSVVFPRFEPISRRHGDTLKTAQL